MCFVYLCKSLCFLSALRFYCLRSWVFSFKSITTMRRQSFSLAAVPPATRATSKQHCLMLSAHRQTENTAEVLLTFKRAALEVTSSHKRLLERQVTTSALLHNHSEFRVAWGRSSQSQLLQVPSARQRFCSFLLLLTLQPATWQAQDETAAVEEEDEEEEEVGQVG